MPIPTPNLNETVGDFIDRCMSRSEERRVGKEGRARWSPYQQKKKRQNGVMNAHAQIV